MAYVVTAGISALSDNVLLIHHLTDRSLCTLIRSNHLLKKTEVDPRISEKCYPLSMTIVGFHNSDAIRQMIRGKIWILYISTQNR